jgi:NADPH-dependent 2,4-dienoyl-CoA reductase/sulfur reductase-like enzyme
VNSLRIADIAVIGAGPAGLRAAAVAAERGKSVVVLDQGTLPGGQIWRHRDPGLAPTAARKAIDRATSAGVTIISDAQVIDAVSPGELVVRLNGTVHLQRAGALILATGARERFLPFPGWTLPGVVGVGGLQALIKSGLSLHGARVVIAGSGPLLLPVAAAVVQAGGRLVLVAEQAGRGALGAFALALITKPSALRQALHYRRAFRATPYRLDSWVTAAHGADRVEQVTVHCRGRTRQLPCDWLATSAGLCPSVELAGLIGCVCDGDGIAVDADQSTSVAGVWAAGECTGIKGDAGALVEGEIAGCAAAGDHQAAAHATLQRGRRRGSTFAGRLARTFAPRAELRALADATTIVCRCEDVRLGALDPSWSQRQAKLWTRIGMGECQGAVCGPLCETLFGWQRNASRPPLGAPPCGVWAAALRDQSVDVAATATDSSR